MKFSLTWLFYLLVLIFLGGVIVVVTYIVSLASNEKTFFSVKFSKGFRAALLLVIIFFLDSQTAHGIASSAVIVKPLYESEFTQTLIFCFFILLLALIRVVKLLKLEEGPLVKRLLKSNLIKIYACQA